MKTIKLTGKFKTIDYWTICFDQFNEQSDLARQVLRRCAAEHLVERGFNEVGSSDVNHELFAMWQIANKDWHQAFMDEVDAFAAR